MTLALPILDARRIAKRPAAAPLRARISASDLPLAAALSGPPKAWAVITGIEGASYRPLGAVMLCDAEGQRLGNLSSGCIEQDVALHAAACLVDRQPRYLRYGAGSPFLDLTLPCGGGLDIQILPPPDPEPLQRLAADLAARRPGRLHLPGITLEVMPELRFLIFGKGPETRALSELAACAGYLVEAFSPEAETLSGLAQGRLLSQGAWPEGVIPDPRSAVALFFHDHAWEPGLLARALRSEAFYVGAQGSRRAHAARCEVLAGQGLAEAEIARLAVPFGLIPSMRDPRGLAISVLSQILAAAQGHRGPEDVARLPAP